MIKYLDNKMAKQYGIDGYVFFTVRLNKKTILADLILLKYNDKYS